ncbi:MAG: hypothetical protein OXU81_00805 [Gammaproteobacteria bacterium]|nr:hypothetical protein [Gammaproteobacteria bacterium]
MRATPDNLKEYAAAPLAQWLIQAAKRRSTITYGEAKRRLETEFEFDRIFPTRMGAPAGRLMDRLLHVRPDCPLVNVLLVRQGDGMPGEGAGYFMANYLGQPRLARPGYRDRHPMQWRAACDEIATDVYAFRDWEQVYREAFGHRLPAPVPSAGTERDGISHARRGEGPNHKALRLWIKKNPRRVRRAYADFDTDTEVILDSADRVDVVYYGPTSTVVVEVKSLDSDDTDLRRGVFQCIKYRAVMEAMDMRSETQVVPVLVTQAPLPGDLGDLVRRHGIRHFKAPTRLD